jgi:excisionase family DNA binding protein
VTNATYAPKETLTTGQVARCLGVSERTVQRLADRGILKASRLAPYSPRRFSREQVERILERLRAEGAL